MVTFELRIDSGDWRQLIDLEESVRQAFDAAAATTGLVGNASILLTDDAALKTLNRDFRGKDKVTDVLSFPAGEMDKPFLGDIAIGYGVAKRDADLQSKDFTDHFMHLLIHGLLHLAGHDHETEHEANIMEALERKALASLGIADPYSPDTRHRIDE